MPKKKSKKDASQQPAVMISMTPSADDSERESTGILSLDAALGGGVPYGSVVLIGGREDAGKTNMALHIVANAVRKGYRALYFDVENRLLLNKSRFTARRLTPDEMARIEIVPAENAIENIANHIRARLTSGDDAPRVIVIDSIASLHTKSLRLLRAQLQEASAGIGSTARAITDETKDLFTYYALQYKVLFVLTTQLRSAISGAQPHTEMYGARYIRHIAGTIIKLNTIKPPTLDIDDPIPQHITYKNDTVAKEVYSFISATLEKSQLSEFGAKFSVVTRMFLLTIPNLGIYIGDYDPLLEIVMYGRYRDGGFVAREGDKFILKHTGTTFTLREAYANPELREQIVAESKPEMYQLFKRIVTNYINNKLGISGAQQTIPDVDVDEGGEGGDAE